MQMRKRGMHDLPLPSGPGIVSDQQISRGLDLILISAHIYRKQLDIIEQTRGHQLHNLHLHCVVGLAQEPIHSYLTGFLNSRPFDRTSTGFAAGTIYVQEIQSLLARLPSGPSKVAERSGSG